MDINKKVEKITERIYDAYGTDTGILFGISDKNIVKTIIKYTLERTMINLCENCTQEFATCHLSEDCKLIMGDGIGNDNVIFCDNFVKR